MDEFWSSRRSYEGTTIGAEAASCETAAASTTEYVFGVPVIYVRRRDNKAVRVKARPLERWQFRWQLSIATGARAHIAD